MPTKTKFAAILVIISGGFGIFGLNFILDSIIAGNWAGTIANHFNIDYDLIASLIMIPAVASIPLGIAEIVCGVLSLKKKIWSILLSGAIISIFTLLPCGIAALIFAIKARPEFKNFRLQKAAPEARLSKPWRKKGIGVILAILFGPFSWFYTLERDSWKVSIAFAVNINMSILVLINYQAMHSWTPANGTDNWAILGYLVALSFQGITLIMTWIWAIADSALKNYRIVLGKNKILALFIAIFFGPWTWLYTYRQDWWKLLLGLVISYGMFVMPLMTAKSILPDHVPLIIILTIWLLAVINVSIRKWQWYSDYISLTMMLG